ncbi:MAG: chitobiase/beta-hexosaminidase C-terminal domain-containing protein, partial [Verrucomicrobiae bacterium]|nr:chitobiase/beta-hexosaminidase C-terminal domain-containing protein [Verrucomicrobiae bacterium]
MLVSAGLLAQGFCQGVQINEFLALSDDGIEDSDGDASDWIELFNAGASAVDLVGYSLTDDVAEPGKWKFPEGTTLGPGGYLLVFASGKDRAVAGEELHTNFRLGANEGYLGLFDAAGAVVSAFTDLGEQREDVSYGLGVSDATTPQTYVPDEASCTWLVPSEDIGDAWQQPTFDDTGWTAAKLGLGFDYDDITGENGNLQSAMQGVNASVYVRVPFEVENPARVVALSLAMRFEDGFAAFLNGHLIASDNSPDPLAWDSEATGSNPDSQAVIPREFVLTTGDFAGRLVAGTNILAIQGMNGTRGGSDALVYPNLTGAISMDATAAPGYFQIPTPGTANSARVDGFVSATEATPKRGFYEQPFQVTIASPTEGAALYYTLDKTEPTPEEGTLYTGPITIDKTTVLRAAAHRPGFVSSAVETHTYVFLADVVTQSNMHSSVTEDDELGPQMRAALTALPTISLVASNDRDLKTGQSGGGVPSVEQPEVGCSVEWLNPDGSEGFHINCGIARFGGFFTTFDKKSYRLYFRKEYGEASLKYPAFDGFEYEIPPVDEFDSLSLRSGSHDMNQRGAYMSNRYADDTLLDMGQLAPHGRFVHVYLNGEYWGQYHLRERWHAAMFARYFGGKKEDYEAINGDNSNDQFLPGNAYDGTGELWQQARDLIRDGGRVDDTYNMVRTHIDIEDYVSFMVMWGSGDSESEFRAAGGLSLGPPPESPLGVGFKFFLKDADGYLRNHNTSRARHNGPLNLFSALRTEKDPEYLVEVGDILHRYFFNGGPMTTEQNVSRLQKRIDEIKVSFIGEAARWSRSSNNMSGRTYASWNSEMNRYLTGRARVQDGMLRAYQSAGIYPDLPAPVFSQHGGNIPASGAVEVAADSIIYYTTDGTDPRVVGGEPNPAAVMIDGRGTLTSFFDLGATWKYLDDGSDQGNAWTASDFNDSAWAEGPAELGYGDGDEATEVGFGPSASQKFATTYFRRAFEAQNVESLRELTLEIKRDDGAVVYMNGTEVVRDNMPDGEITSTTLASGTADENTFFSFAIDPTVLVNGRNVIAVEIHQQSNGNSDISFDCKLDGIYVQGTPRVPLTSAATVKARAFDGTNWSALNEAFFAPASAI